MNTKTDKGIALAKRAGADAAAAVQKYAADPATIAVARRGFRENPPRPNVRKFSIGK